MRKHIIVGTSGHIDHGKTALIKHLTGIDADRFAEEKQRGITIDIGFAHVKLNDGRDVGFIDVPGHERFIKNMLAGAAGMDMVLLIVSAEEGFKPQTLEHLQILSHLKLEKGVVVFTKSDLVDEESLELVHLEADDVLKGTFLEHAPRVNYSIYDNAAREKLLSLIEASIDAFESIPMHPASRLPIDRVFTMKGHGTVVTGTLLEGTIKVSDLLWVYPLEREVRVKSIQVYGQSVETAYAGQRVALNITCDKDELHRGFVLTSIKDWEPSHVIDVNIEVDNDALHHWQRLRLYHGTSEILCRVATVDQAEIQSGNVQLRLEAPIYCKVNDKFVVRNFSPLYTIGGGKVINAKAKKHVVSEYDESAEIFQQAANRLLESFETAWHPFTFSEKLFEQMPYEVTVCYEGFDALKAEGALLAFGESQFMTLRYWDTLVGQALELLYAFHKDNPIKSGIERETFRSRLNQVLYKGKPNKLSASEFGIVMAKLVRDGKIMVKGNVVCEASFKVVLTKEAENIKRSMISDVKQSGVKPVNIKDIVSKDPKRKKLIEEILYYLINEGFLVKINEEVVLHETHYKKCKDELISFLNSHPSITVADYRDRLDISRKASVDLLEHFDRMLITKRVENTRILLNQ